MRLAEWSFGMVVCAGLVALPGCNDPGARCVETERVIAEDEPTPLGSSAADVLAAVGGERAGTLTWSGGTDGVDVEPGGGTTGVTVELRHAERDEVRVIDSERKGGGNRRLACSDELQIDGTLELRTDDGALDESWPVTAVTQSPARAQVRLELREVGVSGSMSATPTEPSRWRDEGVELSVHLDARDTRGDIVAWTRTEDGPDDDGATSANGLRAPVAELTAAP